MTGTSVEYIKFCCHSTSSVLLRFCKTLRLNTRRKQEEKCASIFWKLTHVKGLRTSSVLFNSHSRHFSLWIFVCLFLREGGGGGRGRETIPSRNPKQGPFPAWSSICGSISPSRDRDLCWPRVLCSSVRHLHLTEEEMGICTILFMVTKIIEAGFELSFFLFLKFILFPLVHENVYLSQSLQFRWGPFQTSKGDNIYYEVQKISDQLC